jgi:hypothetical protein
MVQVGNHEFLFFSLSYLACIQIWLNISVDYRHFGYITKLTPKNCHPQEDLAKFAYCILVIGQRAKYTFLTFLSYFGDMLLEPII